MVKTVAKPLLQQGLKVHISYFLLCPTSASFSVSVSSQRSLRSEQGVCAVSCFADRRLFTLRTFRFLTFVFVNWDMHDPTSALAGMLPFESIGLYEQPKPRFIFKMPRVVPDQKAKFESDELFRRLSRESEVNNYVLYCILEVYQK